MQDILNPVGASFCMVYTSKAEHYRRSEMIFVEMNTADYTVDLVMFKSLFTWNET